MTREQNSPVPANPRAALQALQLPALWNLCTLHKQHHETLGHRLVVMHSAILCIEADTQQGLPCRQRTRLSPSLCI